MSDRNIRISEEEARELWRRAAELHAAAESRAAAEREPDRTRALAGGEVHDLSLVDVSAAAEGAGIDPDYVRLAVAERRLPDADEIRRDRWSVRWARRLVSATDAIEVSRFIAAPPQRILETLHEIVANPPYNLHLESRIGDDPVVDGVFVYRIADRTGPFGGAMDFADARVLLVTVRAEGSGGRLRFRIPLYRRGVNVFLSGLSTGIFGAGGSAAGVSVGGGALGLLGVASAAALLVPAGIGAVAGGALGYGGYRALHRSVFGKAKTTANMLLATVALECEGGALPPPGVS